jgi:hemerythrin
VRYAQFHFLSEENLMMRHRYPGLEEHQKLHHELLGSLSTHMLRDNDEATITFLVNWFKAHTVQEDRKFCDFVQAGSAGD